MCKTLRLWWEDLDGNRLPEVDEIVYEGPDTFTPEQPTCTCWIGGDEPEAVILRRHFVETALKPMLDKPYVGRIVIKML